MMAEDWVWSFVTTQVLLSSVIRLCNDFCGGPQVEKTCTIHNLGSNLRVQLVTFQDQHPTRLCLAECVL